MSSEEVPIPTEYKIQQVVWAKIVGYPHWPAVIIDQMDVDSEKPSKKSNSELFAVRFLAEYTTAWVEHKHIVPYEENKNKYDKGCKSQMFIKAMQEADYHLQNQKEDSQYQIKFNITRKRKSPAEKTFPANKLEKSNVNVNVNVSNEDISRNLNKNLQIGVVGIGLVGEELVKHLINSGQNVNICNRTYRKCKKVEKDLNYNQKLKLFITPRAVLLQSDIIFVCLSDDETTERVINWDFEASSETENIIQNKGILVMTKIKPETSEMLNEKIKSKGGKYLEVAFQGDRQNIIEGNLKIYTAGDESLFHICQPFFKAISTSSYFFGLIGYGLKINLIIEMVKAVSLGVFAEGISLAENLGIPPEIFLKVFEETDIQSVFLRKKASAITGKTFNLTEQPLQQMQAELKAVLEIAESVEQPITLANTANEIYKDCKRFRYGSCDISAIYLKNRRSP